MKRKMKLKINSVDALQIAKALKSGWLDTDKVDSLKKLVEGYNPPREIKKKEVDFYKDCLLKAWGYIPTDQKQVEEITLGGLDEALLNQWQSRIESGQVYRMMVRQAYMGLLAVKALGGKFVEVEPDFGFMDKEPPEF